MAQSELTHCKFEALTAAASVLLKFEAKLQLVNILMLRNQLLICEKKCCGCGLGGS